MLLLSAMLDGATHRRVLLQRLRLPAVALVATHVVGVLGFHVLWADQGGTWLDALFMTFITITTIGFGEVHPLSPAARILTMAIAASGIGSLFYSFTVVLEYATSDQVRAARRRRKMEKTIANMSGHFVVAGVGRVGREAVSELSDAGRPFVVIDPNENAETFCVERSVPFVHGDASDDAVLNRAGVTRARGLIVTTSNDATNLYVILSARLLNPELFIVARAADQTSIPKLLRAGANRAINPYAIGGRRLAHLLISPRVVDYFETALKRGSKSLNIDDIVVTRRSAAVGRRLGELELSARSGASVLALLRDEMPLPNGGADSVLQEGDHLLVLGTDDQLAKLEQLLPREPVTGA